MDAHTRVVRFKYPPIEGTIIYKSIIEVQNNVSNGTSANVIRYSRLEERIKSRVRQSTSSSLYTLLEVYVFWASWKLSSYRVSVDLEANARARNRDSVVLPLDPCSLLVAYSAY